MSYTVNGKEWNGEGLPPVGVECELNYHENHAGWCWAKIEFINETAVVWKWDHQMNKKESCCNSHSNGKIKFRPIRTHKERVIEKAFKVSCDAIGAPDTAVNSDYRKTLINAFYDADMLIDPKDKEPNQ